MSEQLTVEQVGQLKVTELRNELAARDLPVKGLKKELVERLTEALQQQENGQAEAAQADPSGQAAGEAPEHTNGTEQATENLPAELPAVPPANETSANDYEGAEPTLSQSAAAGNGESAPETSGEPSAVVKPAGIDSLDKTPGFTVSTAGESLANESAATGAETGAKRKLDEVDSASVLPVNAAPEPVAVQAESALEANDPVPAPAPAVDPAGAEGQPEAKRIRTDDSAHGGAPATSPDHQHGSAAAPATNDIPVPALPKTSDIPVPSEPQADEAPVAAVPVTTGVDGTQEPPVLPVNDASMNEVAGVPNGGGATLQTATEAAQDQSEPKSVPASHTLARHRTASSSTSLGPPAGSAELFSRRGDALTADRVLNGRDNKSSTAGAQASVLSIKGRSNVATSHEHALPTPTSGGPVQTEQAEKLQSINDERGARNDPVRSAGDTDSADASRPPPSNTICISNLVRPFTASALRELLEEAGQVVDLRLNAIKSHCFVTYDSEASAATACDRLNGRVWPETVGKVLETVYVPSDIVPKLLEQESAGGRQRLELAVSWSEAESRWLFEMLPPSSVPGLSQRLGAPAVRGLASATPSAIRAAAVQTSAVSPTAPVPREPLAARLGINNGALVGTRSPPLPRTAVSSVQPSQPPLAPSRSESATWQPSANSLKLYKQTRTLPLLYWRPVDPIAAGRKLRELERQKRQYTTVRPREALRDSYRP